VKWQLEQLQASCADYVGRIGRCLRGEVPPSAHYVTSTGQALRDTASRLVETSHDIARMLPRCGDEVLRDWDGERLVEECALPASHQGRHDPWPPRPPLEQAVLHARDLAWVTQMLADVLAWAERSGGVDADTRREITERLRKMHWDLRDLAREFEAIPVTDRSIEPGSHQVTPEGPQRGEEAE
jgi:hypothetical protein